NQSQTERPYVGESELAASYFHGAKNELAEYLEYTGKEPANFHTSKHNNEIPVVFDCGTIKFEISIIVSGRAGNLKSMPSLPQPTIRLSDKKIELLIDWHILLEPSSIEDAVALLVALYAVFELKFTSHNVAIRLPYVILFNDKKWHQILLENF
ncbi:unnamed protein product, partial [Didymodactylos carnosus]